MYSLLLVIALVSTVSCQTIEDGWKGVKPLKTDKAAVEKLFGKPEVVDDNDYHGYRTDGAFIQVNYSTAPCKENQYNRGKYNVPADTILDYTVNFKDRIKFSDLKVDKEKYNKEMDGHVGDLVYYTSRDNSIRITAIVQNEAEYVGKISFRATKSDSEKFQCAEK